MITRPNPIQKGAAAMGASVPSAGKTSTGMASALSAIGVSDADVKAVLAQSASAGGTTGGPSGVTTKTTYAPGAKTADINTIWRQYTGKDASKKQVNAITAAINAAMQASPDKSTNTGGDFSTTSKVVGVDPNEIIKEQALKDPTTPNYMAATTYYDAMMSAIKGPMGGGY